MFTKSTWELLFVLFCFVFFRSKRSLVSNRAGEERRKGKEGRGGGGEQGSLSAPFQSPEFSLFRTFSPGPTRFTGQFTYYCVLRREIKR